VGTEAIPPGAPLYGSVDLPLVSSWTDPIGEAGINLLQRRAQLEKAQAQLLVRLAREADDGVPMRPVAGGTPAGNPARLRGIPAVSRGGLGGAIRWTRPTDALRRLD
jgi:hypothetical protein